MLAGEGFNGDTVRLARELDLSYRGQQWVVRVALGDGGGRDAADVRKRFEEEYDRLYGHTQPEGIIEISNQRVVGTGMLPGLTLGGLRHAASDPEPLETRSAFVSPEIGWRDTPVYAGADLRPGHCIDGPLLVEERTTTVLVGAGDRLEIDEADNLVIRLST